MSSSILDCIVCTCILSYFSYSLKGNHWWYAGSRAQAMEEGHQRKLWGPEEENIAVCSVVETIWCHQK